MITMVNRIKILEELKKYPVFSIMTLGGIIDKGNDYSKLVAYRLKKSGLITQLERDKYTVQGDALLVASHIVWPCYVSSWAAIRYYGMTEQLPNSIQIITTRARKKRRMQFKNATIEFITIKREYFFGFGKVQYGEFEIFMAEREKALADVLYLKHTSLGTFLETIRQHRKQVDIKKLVAYLKKMRMHNAISMLKKVRVYDKKR
jgi:predicted transcriptional regulator of viral defense system